MLTQGQLKQEVMYDPLTGKFTRLTGPMRGDEAGSIYSEGYRVIVILGRRHRASRLAWLYVYGEFPRERLRHIDCNPDNTRIENLKSMDQQEIRCDMRKAKRDTKSGLLGVSWDQRKRKWRASIMFDGKRKYLGYFHDKHLAHREYLIAKKIQHPESRLANVS